MPCFVDRKINSSAVDYDRPGIAARIVSYEKRKAISSFSPEREQLIKLGIIKPKNITTNTIEQDKNDKFIKIHLLKVFSSFWFPWGARGQARVYDIVHTFAGGRPRWALQLCRMAAKEAKKVKSNTIKFGHIKQILESYGRFRLDDVAREHTHQCPNVNLVVNCFSNQKCNYSTDQLVDYVRKTVIKNIEVKIDDELVNDPINIARFLFRVGFFIGTERNPTGTLKYYTFEEKPDLLKNISNLDDGLIWSIHPSFRAALSVTD